mmetsp:Transcript_13746/g.24721  ORF Transcript_13746/g.24721 Transcript_13746/m.24721 type:complete len:155 (+) Transcript_13746:44-508(+)
MALLQILAKRGMKQFPRHVLSVSLMRHNPSPVRQFSSVVDPTFYGIELESLDEKTRRVFDEKNCLNMDRVIQKKREAIKQFQIRDGDTGSPQAQIAGLTVRIANLARHMKENHKDVHSKRGLDGLLTKRRKLLEYLRKNDFDSYRDLVFALDLK